jgi:hypothetical protein
MVLYGLDSELKLALFEMGLTDREAIIKFSNYLNIPSVDKESLKKYIHSNVYFLRNISRDNIPSLSYRNIMKFIDSVEVDNGI